MKNLLKRDYNPLYFLASLGNGGLAVSFFMYLMFMIKHPDTPMVTFNHIYPVLTGQNILSSVMVVISLLCIVYFAFQHFRLPFWNVNQYLNYKRTVEFVKLKNSNSEISLMAIPLTFAMSINVIFVLGAVFVPGLWNYVELLFPFALLGFFTVGIFALKIFTDYAARIIMTGNFDFAGNNNLSQMLSSFTFAMIAVGFAAPGAMSQVRNVSVLGIFMALFFGGFSLTLMFITLVLGLKSVLKQGISKEGSPSLWIIIPILTLLGITFVRLASGISHNLLHTSPSPVLMFVILSILVSLQVIAGVMGYTILNKLGYFKEYIGGDKKSPGSYALICPGVAFFVLGMFFISWGLVKTSVIQLFSPAHFLILIPFVLIQFKTIDVMFKLNKKLLTYRTPQNLDLQSSEPAL